MTQSPSSKADTPEPAQGRRTILQLDAVSKIYRSGDGEVHLAVFATPATFPDSDAILAEAIVRAKAGGVYWVFTGLKPGTYALAVYHDENENREFDTGFLGIPLEGFGFSNDAPVFFGPPDFADAAVTVPGKGARITIRMTY